MSTDPITPAARRAARDESAWAEQERNRRLAENIVAGTDVLRGRTDEVIAGVRGMAIAHLDVPGPRALQLIEEVERLRAELARRDTTVAAVRKMGEELAEAAPSLTGTARAAQQQIALALRSLLPAPVEADPSQPEPASLGFKPIAETLNCGCCEIEWELCRGLVDKGIARCCADCTHDLSAPVEAGAPAEPTSDTEP